MHNIEVVLVVVVVDPKNPSEMKFVVHADSISDQFHLPTLVLGNESSIECAATILHNLTGLKAKLNGSGWVELVPGPIMDDKDRLVSGQRWIAITYGAMLPTDFVELKDKDARLLLITDLLGRMSDDNLQILKSCTLLV